MAEATDISVEVLSGLGGKKSVSIVATVSSAETLTLDDDTLFALLEKKFGIKNIKNVIAQNATTGVAYVFAISGTDDEILTLSTTSVTDQVINLIVFYDN